MRTTMLKDEYNPALPACEVGQVVAAHSEKYVELLSGHGQLGFVAFL